MLYPTSVPVPKVTAEWINLSIVGSSLNTAIWSDDEGQDSAERVPNCIVHHLSISNRLIYFEVGRIVKADGMAMCSMMKGRMGRGLI